MSIDTMDTDCELVLYPSTRKSVWYLAVSLLFLWLGARSLPHGGVSAWLVTIASLLGTCAFAAQLVPGSSHLRLTSTSLECRTMWRTAIIIDREKIDYCFVTTLPHQPLIAIKLKDNTDAQSGAFQTLKRVNRSHRMLSDTYGMSVTELCDLLNRWKGGIDLSSASQIGKNR